MLKIFILVLVFLIQNIWAGSIISGKVTGADGKVPEKADAHITNLGGDVYSPAKTVNVDDDGQFRFELEDGKYYTLFITAANHLGLKIPIISDKNNQSLELNIQLESIAYLDEFKEVKIIGEWNKFSFRSAEEMKVQDDGTFIYELKSDQEKVGYQLLYLDGTGHSVNGTMFDDLEYDGGGDYRSIVKTENGTARIIFDPKKLIKSTSNTFSVTAWSGSFFYFCWSDFFLCHLRSSGGWFRFFPSSFSYHDLFHFFISHIFFLHRCWNIFFLC